MIWHKLKQFWHSLNSHSEAETPTFKQKKEVCESSFYDQCQSLFSEDNASLSVKEKTVKTTSINTTKDRITITPFQPELSVNQIQTRERQTTDQSSSHQIPLPPRQNKILPPQLNQTKTKTQKTATFQDLSPSRSLQLPTFNTFNTFNNSVKAPLKPQINSQIKSKVKHKKSSRLDQVIWQDCEDVYRPIEKPIAVFLQESNLLTQLSPVYIDKTAYLTIINHLKSDLKKEQGGILFGNAYRDPQKGIYVKIVKAIAAPNTLSSKAHLEFTAQTWQGIMDYAKKINLSENMVGWYHSHPNLGVFMSNTDLKTQEAFFYHPWCLSIVYDPVRHEIGYFLGEKAQPVRPVICNCVILN